MKEKKTAFRRAERSLRGRGRMSLARREIEISRFHRESRYSRESRFTELRWYHGSMRFRPL